MQLTRTRAFFLVLLISLSSAFVVSVGVRAIPAPSRSSTIEPGSQTTPCTYDNYQDSGKFIGRNCQTGKNDFSESTALALWNDENTSGIARFWEGGTWNVGGGFTINNLSGVTDWGVYGQTIFQTTTASSVVVAVGNQNANDANYHAFNYTIHDITFDGGGLATTACFSITTTLNVYVNHVIFQNCFELGTGCFRLTNWNANQIISKGVYVENSQFIQCKITLSGAVNGYLRNSAFIGQTPSDTQNFLVDFSKGDIVPTKVNNLGNFCFCGNTISGWTVKGIFGGFQAISNDTIAQNTVRDAPTFIATTDTAGGIYFEGLKVTDNYYSSATGGIAIGYGHSIILASNIVSFDTSPASFSTVITIEESQDHSVNMVPKNVQILNNEIYKWGGIGMDLGFKDGTVLGNEIYDVNQFGASFDSDPGILIQANLTNTVIASNSIISDVNSGPGQSRPITYLTAAKNVTVIGNYLFYQNFGCAQGAGIKFSVTADPTFQAYNNNCFNPFGKITNDFISGFVGLCGTGTTPVASTNYQVCGMPISMSTTGGTGVSITIFDPGGNTLQSGIHELNATYLPIGYKVNFGGFSVNPTVVVFGA